MITTERVERFIVLDKEERETLIKASTILGEIGRFSEIYGKVSLPYEKFADPVKRIREHDEEYFYDLATLLSTLSLEEEISVKGEN